MSYISLEEFETNVIELSDEIGCPPEIVERLFTKYPNIFRASGSSKPEVHHYGTNGLAEHTMEVINLSLKTLYVNVKPNALILFFAALFHDTGKAWDYEETEPNVWVPTLHRLKIHHISRSCWIWRECAEGILPEILIDEICHCILSHHGRREWGSPVQPMTPEAHVLHHCDSISARLFEL